MAKKSRTVAPRPSVPLHSPSKDHERRQRITDAIEALRDEHGRVTAEQVIAAAKHSEHPLHTEFDWDIERAAHAHWIDRANALIRYVTVVVIHKSERITVPFYVRDRAKHSKEAGMIALNSDMIDRRHAEKIMLAELSRCRSAIERARGIVDILDKNYPGLSRRLEQMLNEVIAAELQLNAA